MGGRTDAAGVGRAERRAAPHCLVHAPVGRNQRALGVDADAEKVAGLNRRLRQIKLGNFSYVPKARSLGKLEPKP